MLWALRQLLVPVNYLRIKHGKTLFHSKAVYDFVMPLLLAIATLAGFWWLDISYRLSEHPRLVKSLTDLLALMIVFYMAALAAVATFDREGIDDPLPDNDATLVVKDPDGGAPQTKVLSY